MGGLPYYATDALQSAMMFVDGLDQRVMTSSASRLATVQREIESLATALNPDPDARASFINNKIKALQDELRAVEDGEVSVLSTARAEEGVLEVYQLAMSLRADFRRVEDSYRDADRALRQSIIGDQQHRGEVVDQLLDSHDALLETPEGQVFHGFHEQLVRSQELEAMKTRLRQILANPATDKALTRQQRADLRWLVTRLVSEARNVIEARSRSERDVKGFIKTGLAAEHHRVGKLLNELIEVALDIDWRDSGLRKSATPLPPVAIGSGPIPVLERLRFKEVADEAPQTLELRARMADLDEVDAEFWEAFDSLDQEALLADTVAVLERVGHPLSLAALAEQLPPSHDLETLACWLQMARDAGLSFDDTRELLSLIDSDDSGWRFEVPYVELDAACIQRRNEQPA